MTSLTYFIDGQITCKCFIEGRSDAYDNKELRIQKPNETLCEYKSYSKGYAGYKAFTDKKNNIINANLNWTTEMKEAYDKNIENSFHKINKMGSSPHTRNE
jgi:hypothetical protein